MSAWDEFWNLYETAHRRDDERATDYLTGVWGRAYDEAAIARPELEAGDDENAWNEERARQALAIIDKETP